MFGQEVYVTMEKELDEPYILKHCDREICIYIDISTDYRVTIDEDIETGRYYADSITEEGVAFDVSGCCDNDSGIEIPFEEVISQLSEDEKEALRYNLQDFADMNSGFDDEDIELNALNSL